LQNACRDSLTGGSEQPGLLRQYQEAGIKLVRLDGKTRRPIDRVWQDLEVSPEDIEKHVRNGGGVGMQCGERSGWLSVVDLDWPEAVRLAPRFLPDTLRAAKGDESPSHYVYRSEGLGFKTFKEIGGPDEVISVKASNNGKGHQAVVEPTMHPKKGRYAFERGFDSEAIARIDRDELRRRVGMLAVAALVGRLLPEKGRHALALALSGFLLRNGETPEAVEKILASAWEVRDAPSEGVEDARNCVRDTARKLRSGEKATGGRTLEKSVGGLPERIADYMGWEKADRREPGRSYRRTDLGNSERFVDHHGEDVRFCFAWGRWLVWDGTRWKSDDTGAVERLAKQTVRSIYQEAADATDADERKALGQHAARSEAHSRLQAMIALARSEAPVTPDELDGGNWLLNVANGTLDLRSGELREHSRGDLITKLAPVEYDPDAPAPTWVAFLERVLPPESLRGFVRRLCGYALTGDTSGQVLPFFHGSGANGKSTLLNTVLAAMGEYGQQAAPDLLMLKGSSHPTELADLFGARLVASVELEDGKRLAESLVKQLTGGEKVKARYMRQDFWEFEPTHKTFLVANHKPEVKGTDHAIWRRIKLVPFDVQIPEAEQNARLPEKLRDELPGVLAWAVSGCLEWQRNGLGEPEEVKSATESYRAQEDVLAAFIEDRCVVSPTAVVGATKLHGEYKEWCKETGEDDETQKRFGERLRERGFESARNPDRNARRKVWRGIGLWSGPGV